MPSYLQNGVFPEDMAMLTKKQQCSPQSGSHEFVWSGLTTRINSSSKNRISGGKKNEQKGGSTPVGIMPTIPLKTYSYKSLYGLVPDLHFKFSTCVIPT